MNLRVRIVTIPTFKIIIIKVILYIKDGIDITDKTKLTSSRDKNNLQKKKNTNQKSLDTFNQLNPV